MKVMGFVESVLAQMQNQSACNSRIVVNIIFLFCF